MCLVFLMNFMTMYFTELPHFKPPAQRRPDRLHNISQISLPAGLDVWSESWSAGGVERSIPHPPVSQRSGGTTVWIYRASHCTMVLAHCRICKLVLTDSLFYTVLFENNLSCFLWSSYYHGTTAIYKTLEVS